MCDVLPKHGLLQCFETLSLIDKVNQLPGTGISETNIEQAE